MTVAIIVLVIYLLRRRAKVAGHLETDDSLSAEKDEKNPSFLSFGSTKQAGERVHAPVQSNIKINEGAEKQGDFVVQVEDLEEAV